MRVPTASRSSNVGLLAATGIVGVVTGLVLPTLLCRLFTNKKEDNKEDDGPQPSTDPHAVRSGLASKSIRLDQSELQTLLSQIIDQAAAIIMPYGGSLSHLAIIARAAKCPAIFGCKEAVLQIPEGTEITLQTDGSIKL